MEVMFVKRSGKQWNIACATSRTSGRAVKNLNRVNCLHCRRCLEAEVINPPCLICRNPLVDYRRYLVLTSRRFQTCRNRPVG